MNRIVPSPVFAPPPPPPTIQDRLENAAEQVPFLLRREWPDGRPAPQVAIVPEPEGGDSAPSLLLQDGVPEERRVVLVPGKDGSLGNIYFREVPTNTWIFLGPASWFGYP